ncbi:hypothetical protein BDP27DRAFT_1378753 [Rhodocollybia butyracea]|uniref:Uncharacterized protein n=1 Tax=Rhodocollybia butyracea TaxID=206335 RepID=A0A9P5P2E3_9AGAR|nr:hypothetical protein BDP27DRAFT_1378753 [Rhodocollybia butyracea]
MTPEEVAAVSSTGLGLFEDVASKIVFLSILLGIYSMAYCVSLYIYFKTKILELLKYGLIVTLPGGVLEQRVATESQLTVYNKIHAWLTNFIPLIADTVIVWRAWAVWMDNTKVKWTLLLLILADIAFRAWLHHKSMSSISIRRKQTQGERILLLLIESGAIYMLVQLNQAFTLFVLW